LAFGHAEAICDALDRDTTIFIDEAGNYWRPQFSPDELAARRRAFCRKSA
jgi:hypothetical protein